MKTFGGAPATVGADRLLTRYGDVILAAAVIAIVGAMILPLPTWLLDGLLATNIAVAVILLLLGIYVDRPLSFSSLPSLLLITTLFRLALNVSSTRLILGQADAGSVIDAFGGFVVAGDMVVGAVVFLILTIVQFVVIAKGSERVAEVSARFALDGMPGKQMSIDADLRAGLIDGETAGRRRRNLERESQLFGAMDGAMKFVKGDAIAGILITAINILGGLAIGVLRMDMPVAEALGTYGLLTIGDGLVSQIPALLIATSAGLVVTRVTGEEADSPLSREIGRQILARPRVVAIAAGLLLFIGLVPGMPFAPFVVLALFCGLAALALLRRRAAPAAASASRVPAAPVELALALDTAAGEMLGVRDPDGAFARELNGVTEAVAADLGLPLPIPLLQVDATLGAGAYRVLLRGVAVEHGVASGEGRVGQLAGRLAASLRRHARELIGIQEARRVLDDVRRDHPALAEAVERIPAHVLAATFRLLVAEGVGVADRKTALEALAAAPEAEQGDPAALTERVRAALVRRITALAGGERKEVAALLLEPMVEEELRASVRSTAEGAFLALGPELGQEIVAAVRAKVAEALGQGERPVLLASADVRRFVRALLEAELPDLPVITYRELLPETRLRHLGSVGPGAPTSA